MDIDISWALIGKAVLAWIGIYLLSPILLIARDMVLWRAVDKFVMDDTLGKAITKKAAAELRQSLQSGRMFAISDPVTPTYRIGDREVDAEEFERERAKRAKDAAEILEADMLIARRRSTLDALIRYFKQPVEMNGIDSLINERRVFVQQVRSSLNQPDSKKAIGEFVQSSAKRGAGPSSH